MTGSREIIWLHPADHRTHRRGIDGRQQGMVDLMSLGPR
jgi:hypothetical protein